jgi:hypothetical protein
MSISELEEELAKLTQNKGWKYITRIKITA